MMQKGYLKSGDGISTLSADTTTIGKENCDIFVNDSCVDKQHAVIQYSHDEDCYVLHDLNSAEGTYVNNCRVQNSAVRLAPGDIIKFGHSGQLFELLVDNNSMVTQYLPVQQRPSWNSPIQILVSSPRNNKNDNGTFPMINLSSVKSSPNISPAKSSSIQPHPPLHLRSRSAEPFQRSPNMNPVAFAETGDASKSALSSADMTANILLREKDNKIIQMGDEISRLAIYEQESKRKDNLVTSLRDEVAHLHERISSDQQLSSTQIYQRLQSLEKELTHRRNEATLLRDQLNCVNRNLGVSPTLTTKLTESEKKVRDLSQELEKARRESAMAQGLVQSLQREISTQESSYQKASSELTLLRKENKKKEIQLSSISSKLNKLNEDKTKDDMIDSLKREIKDTKIKQSVAEKRAGDQLKLLQTYKDEVSKFQSKHQNAVDDARIATKQLDEFKQRYYEMQRSERMLKVDMEQCKSRLDRFRVRVLNIVYSCPGMKIPSDMMAVDDNEVADDLKKIIKKKMEMKEKLELTEDELHQKEGKMKDYASSAETCKTEIQNMLDRVSKSGHQTHVLKNESELLSSLSVAEGDSCWVYKIFSAYMEGEMKWITALDQVLIQAGYDVSVTEKHPSEHVSDLHRSLQGEKYSHQQTRDLYKELEVRHQEELQNSVAKLLRENEEKLAAQIESVRLEEEEKFQHSLEDLHEKEREKRLKAVDEEREKMASANLGIEQLRKLLAEKQEEEENLRKKLQMAFEDNEKQKTIEQQLRDELGELERDQETKRVTSSQHFDDIKREYEADIKQHKEEIRQHSITIVSMEEKLRSLTSKKQEDEQLVQKLRNRLKDLEERSRAPPPPQPVSTVQSDQEITFLKTELFHAGQEIATLKNTILGLRRDLSGSQARLSDMTGELSESQKLELERNRSQCKDQEVELNTLRQKLLKLSTIVDSQKSRIESLTIDLKKKDSAIKKREMEASEKVDNIKDLEAQLENERTKLVVNDQVEIKKGKIAEELSSVGAQCRGERHEEIISRQCEALAELRARVKALEQIRPPLPSQEQALQQVILLKKELAEIRAKQAMEEDKHFQAQLSLGKESLDNQHQLRTVTTQASIERTAREQLETSLEFAERSYMDLLNNLASVLGISSLSASGTMLHLPTDEREKLMTQRKKDLDKVCSNVKSALQQLDRKEQLLQGYENDLIKLREAEHFASNKSHRVESLSQHLAEKAEEVEHLREALTQSNEQLELERRLNKSIKQRKTFYLENLDYRRPPPQAKSSYQSEIDLMKKKSSKAKQNNKIKRKQYEIDVLKERVYGKERELCSTTARLVNQAAVADDEVLSIHQQREKLRFDNLVPDT